LRTYDRINGPLSFIQEMEKNSSVPFFQAQVALSRQWLGNRIDANEDKSVKINVIVPTANTGDKKSLGATEGTKKEEAAKVTEYVLPDSEEEAKAKIAQFESGAPRSDQEVSDTIGQHVQFDRTALNAEKWLGTEQEERDW
jgi:phospholipase D1/2